MRYTWKPGTQIKVAAQIAGERLEELSHALGRPLDGLKSTDVLADARSPKSPLHDAFEWDNTIAAEKFRQSQASLLLRSLITVYVNVEKPTEPPKPTRVFVGLPDRGGRSRERQRTFYPTIKVLSDDEKRAQLLEQARSEYQVFKLKYQDIQELSRLFEEGDLIFGRIPRTKKHKKSKA